MAKWSIAQGDVLIWSGEDSVGDTLKPRLLAMGADSARIRFIHATRDEGGARPFDPATDMAQLGAAASQMEQLKFLIIDPVSAAVQGDRHKAGEVRAGLGPVVNLPNGSISGHWVFRILRSTPAGETP